MDVAKDTVLFPDAVVKLDGGTLMTTEVSFDGGGQFDWTGGNLHVNVFRGDLINQGGILAPGGSTGGTAIVGDYIQQADATLAIEFGGTVTNTEHDFLSVTDTALLDGELELALIDNFVPSPSDAFTVLEADNLVGSFDNAANGQRLATIDGGGSFLVHYGPTSTLDPNEVVLTDLELAPTLPGDYNGDGVVNAVSRSQEFTDARQFLLAKLLAR